MISMKKKQKASRSMRNKPLTANLEEAQANLSQIAEIPEIAEMSQTSVQSGDLILTISTLATQLHQTQEELEESQALSALLQRTLDRTHAQLTQLQTEKEWFEAKYNALKQTAQLLQKDLQLAQSSR
jgi:hypothetical protein